MAIPTDLISTKQAARLLGVHLNTVYRWIHEGYLPCYKRRSRYRVSRADVLAKVEAVELSQPAGTDTQREKSA